MTILQLPIRSTAPATVARLDRLLTRMRTHPEWTLTADEAHVSIRWDCRSQAAVVAAWLQLATGTTRGEPSLPAWHGVVDGVRVRIECRTTP